ncbi:hypothetical protein [Kineococcus rhizosphaerae]|uniref:DUF559 domain-containing protein n=1 Tax=Kineococcus rhizosphaerae TaxID=559628 RepID=A0A2T0QXP2_9ACTN|nr:hypothetical protein [Kineococcus rhizosphaerae]PRY10795.1 hypothetical protein CLV37_11559 [Kineococcus rhizosphaerae]
MPRLNPYDRAAVDELFRPHGLARYSALVELGVPKSTLTHRTRTGGRWQRILPGVVLGHSGTPSTVERRRAALAYCGSAARISGKHALELHGSLTSALPAGEPVLVVIPNAHHRTSSHFCVVERSERDTGVMVRGGFPVTSPARACADAVRGHDVDLDEVRELMSGVLRRRLCTLRHLQEEVLSGPTQRSGPARRALAELRSGARSVAEIEAQKIVGSSRLPQPVWNEPVVVDGRWVGNADAYWPGLGVVLEIDSMLWHLGAGNLRRTQAKARRYAAAGLVLVSIAPADLTADPRAFLELLRDALSRAAALRGLTL